MASFFWTKIAKKLYYKLPADGFYRVTAVADGDTFSILVNGEVMICRLSGIDTPEMGQQMGKVCKAFLLNKILDQVVYCHFLKKGKYGRLICHVFIGLDLLQVLMLRKGMGYVYAKYVDPKYRDIFEEAELFAWRHRLGVHSDCLAVRPWDFRNNSNN